MSLHFWPNARHDLLILEVSRSHATTHHSSRTLLDEGSAPRRDLYLTTHNTLNRRDIHASGGIRNPPVPASEWPQTHALNHATTGIGRYIYPWFLIHLSMVFNQKELYLSVDIVRTVGGFKLTLEIRRLEGQDLFTVTSD